MDANDWALNIESFPPVDTLQIQRSQPETRTRTDVGDGKNVLQGEANSEEEKDTITDGTHKVHKLHLLRLIAHCQYNLNHSDIIEQILK